ncbi:hypothetical protein CDAR_240971 [Caerostris darwini]|uniref:Uncharacterized protein n=1 Tax=Caerostris darwini TaxID=1538125 RepID=A0AAV4TFB3_9ARAC|nr:hypothetical protein CDAR_240971 [Caerostris darwini]
MSQAQASANTDLVSKVSFFPVEDRTGENKALIVTIKKVVPEGDELFRRMESPKRSMSMESPKRSMSMDSKRKTRSSRTSTDKSKNKSTMTEDKGVSLSTQTAVELPVPSISGTGRPALDSSPCLKHAAQNISSKASHIPSEKVSLCNNCSKSMLSYIFLVQDFLDSLAKEICGDTDSKNCVQCLRQENRISVIEETAPKSERKSSKSRSKSSENLKSASSKQGDDSRTKKSAPAKDSSHEVRRYEETAEKLIQRSISEHQKIHQHSPSHQEGNSFTSEGQKEGSQSYYQGDQTSHNRLNDHSGSSYHQGQVESGEQQNRSQDYSGTESQRNQSVSGHISQQDLFQQRSHHGLSYPQDNIHPGSSAEQIPPVQQHEQQMASYQENPQASNWSSQDDKLFRKPMDRQQPNFTDSVFHEHKGGEGSNQDSFHNAEGVSSPFSDGMENFVAPLSNVDREVYDAARNGAGWEGSANRKRDLLCPPIE